MTDSRFDPRRRAIEDLRKIDHPACNLMAMYYEKEQTIPGSIRKLAVHSSMALLAMFWQYKSIVGASDPTTEEQFCESIIDVFKKQFAAGREAKNDLPAGHLLDAIFEAPHGMFDMTPEQTAAAEAYCGEDEDE